MIIQIISTTGEVMSELDITGSHWIVGHNGMVNADPMRFKITREGIISHSVTLDYLGNLVKRTDKGPSGIAPNQYLKIDRVATVAAGGWITSFSPGGPDPSQHLDQRSPDPPPGIQVPLLQRLRSLLRREHQHDP